MVALSHTPCYLIPLCADRLPVRHARPLDRLARAGGRVDRSVRTAQSNVALLSGKKCRQETADRQERDADILPHHARRRKGVSRNPPLVTNG